MKVHILHDAEGSIVSAAVVHPGARLGLAAPSGSHLLEVESELPLERLAELHANFRVDMKSKTLVRR